MAQPGGNITGFALSDHAIAGKWVEMLRELAPRAVRIGVIHDPANAARAYLPHIKKALSPGMQFAPYAVRSRTELEETIERIGSEPDGVLIVLAGPLTAVHRDLIIISAVKHRLRHNDLAGSHRLLGGHTDARNSNQVRIGMTAGE